MTDSRFRPLVDVVAAAFDRQGTLFLPAVCNRRGTDDTPILQVKTTGRVEATLHALAFPLERKISHSHNGGVAQALNPPDDKSIAALALVMDTCDIVKKGPLKTVFLTLTTKCHAHWQMRGKLPTIYEPVCTSVFLLMTTKAEWDALSSAYAAHEQQVPKRLDAYNEMVLMSLAKISHKRFMQLASSYLSHVPVRGATKQNYA